MKYVYTDYSDKPKQIFECEAEDILAADKLYEAAGMRMEENKKGKKIMPSDITCWSPDWSSNA